MDSLSQETGLCKSGTFYEVWVGKIINMVANFVSELSSKPLQVIPEAIAMNQNGYICHNYSTTYLVKLYLYTEAFIKVGG